MKAYFISGLGADEKMFQKIILPVDIEKIYLDWIVPDKKDDFVSYSKRLMKDLDVTSPFILIGLSLGGMLAVEINKFLSPKLTILISSAVNKNQLPLWFRLSGRLGIQKIIPNYFYQHPSWLSNWLLGAKSAEDKKLLHATMRNASAYFVRWAVPLILNWKNTYIPNNMIHLHGTKDVILPFKKGANIIPIQGGTHFMVFNKSEKINQLLGDQIAKLK